MQRCFCVVPSGWPRRLASRTGHPRTVRFPVALSDVLAEAGNVEAAARELEATLDILRAQEPMPGLGLTTDYIWFSFYREAIADELLPGVIRIWVTDEIERLIWHLAEYHEAPGEYEKASQVYHELHETVPGCSKAEIRANLLLASSGPHW